MSDKPETVVDHGLVASIMIVYNPKLVFKLCFVRTILLVFLLMEVRSRVLDHTFGGGVPESGVKLRQRVKINADQCTFS